MEYGFSACRIAGGAESIEGGKIVVDDSGVYGGRFFATKEGSMVEGMSVDQEGVEHFVVAGLMEEVSDDEKSVEKRRHCLG